jgi:polysaccharide deacetylase 2 family uncharacterized protein YibQ
MRGFVAGLVWGLAAGAAGLAVLSLTRPPPAGNDPPEAPLSEAPAQVQGGTAGTAEVVQAVVASSASPDTSPVAAPGGSPAEVPAVSSTDGSLPEEAKKPPDLPRLGAAAGAIDPVPRAPAVAPAMSELVPAHETKKPIVDRRPVAPSMPAPELALQADTNSAPLPAAMPEVVVLGAEAGAASMTPAPSMADVPEAAAQQAVAGDQVTSTAAIAENVAEVTTKDTDAGEVAAAEQPPAQVPEPAVQETGTVDVTSAAEAEAPSVEISPPVVLDSGAGNVAAVERPTAAVAEPVAQDLARDTGAGDVAAVTDLATVEAPGATAHDSGAGDLASMVPSPPADAGENPRDSATDVLAAAQEAPPGEVSQPIEQDTDAGYLAVVPEPPRNEVPQPVAQETATGDAATAPELPPAEVSGANAQDTGTGDVAVAEQPPAEAPQPVAQETAASDVATVTELSPVESPGAASQDGGPDDVVAAAPPPSPTVETPVTQDRDAGAAAQQGGTGQTADAEEGLDGQDLPQIGEAVVEPENTSQDEGGPRLPDVRRPSTFSPAAADEDGGSRLPQIVLRPDVTDEPLPADVVVGDAMDEVGLPGEDQETAMPGIGAAPRVIRPEAAVEPAPDETAEVAEASPLARFAARYEATSGLPRMAVVLLDEGTMPDAVAVVSALPRPVTVAIDPARSDAAAAMAAYRAAGIEVLALMRLPAGAEPTDVAVTYEGLFALLPEAIGLIDTGEGGLQKSGPAREQVLAQLAAEGRGALVAASGLNTAARAAAEAGVALAVIDRSLDAAGASDDALRRTLERTAFSSRQESGEGQGGAVILGEMTEPTLAALTDWFGQREAEQVEIAPVSTILLSQ